MLSGRLWPPWDPEGSIQYIVSKTPSHTIHISLSTIFSLLILDSVAQLESFVTPLKYLPKQPTTPATVAESTLSVMTHKHTRKMKIPGNTANPHIHADYGLSCCSLKNLTPHWKLFHISIHELSWAAKCTSIFSNWPESSTIKTNATFSLHLLPITTVHLALHPHHIM